MSDATKQHAEDGRPRLFISHKHADGAIAKVVADFINGRTLGAVRIHLSSDPGFEGPRIGRDLTEELRRALWRTDALLLLYTTADQDWSWCMFECGVATRPDAPSSSVYVLQCGATPPVIYKDTVVVNARERDGLKRFVNALLRDPDFFPRRRQAVSPNVTEAMCDGFAAELEGLLKPVLPVLDAEPDQAWQTWPSMTVEIPTAVLEKVGQAPPDARAKLPQEAFATLLEAATVTDYDRSQTPALFDKANLPSTLPLKDLVAAGPEGADGAAWAQCCLAQVLRASQRGFVTMGWAPLKHPRSGAQYLPALCRVRNSPARALMSFDVYFIDVLSPEVMPVRSKMLVLGNFHSLDLDDPAVRGRRLLQLRQEMQRGSRSRLPILGGQNRARFIVHKSLVDDFLLGAMDRPGDYGVPDQSALTLGHLLDDPAAGGLATKSFATVGPDDPVAQVERAMRAIPDCRDAFVTQDGTRDTPVLGWITNVDLGR
jgi:hypothetical protein